MAPPDSSSQSHFASGYSLLEQTEASARPLPKVEVAAVDAAGVEAAAEVLLILQVNSAADEWHIDERVCVGESYRAKNRCTYHQ